MQYLEQPALLVPERSNKGLSVTRRWPLQYNLHFAPWHAFAAERTRSPKLNCVDKEISMVFAADVAVPTTVDVFVSTVILSGI